MEFGYFTLSENNTRTSNQLVSDISPIRPSMQTKSAFSPALKLYCPTSRHARETFDSHRPCNDGKFPLWRCTAMAKLLPAWRNQIMNRRKLLQAAGLGLVTAAIAKPAIAHAQG